MINSDIQQLKHDMRRICETQAALNKRLDLVERIFSKVMQQDLRIDTLEFNSNLPVKPGISECLANLIYRVEGLEILLTKKEVEDE